MDIVLVHIGDAPPAHIIDCMRQIRLVTDKRIIVVLSKPEKLKCNDVDNFMPIALNDLQKTKSWRRFNEINFFAKYTSDVLWKYSCKRLFIIEALMNTLGIKKVLHIENDNLIYAEPDTVFLRTYCEKAIGLTAVTNWFLTAGIMYVGNRGTLHAVNNKLIDLMAMGEKKICEKYPKDGNKMIHEMRMLKIIHDDNPELIRLLPIFPDNKSKYVYDCASWGQYVGGTYQYPGKSYSHGSHLIGHAIVKKIYDVVWEDDNGFKRPYVFACDTGEKNPLYNLHIHSKQLNQWMSK